MDDKHAILFRFVYARHIGEWRVCVCVYALLFLS